MDTIRILTSLLALLVVPVCVVTVARSQQPAAQPAVTLSTGEQEFFDAIRQGNSTKVSELVKQQPALIKARWKNGCSVLMFAVYANHPEVAESLIASGIEPDIFEAAATGRLDRVRQLLKQDPNLIHAWSVDGWTALHLNFNHLDVAKFLIDSGADLNVNSRNALNATPLQGAAAANRIELARLYLSRGANVNCRSSEGISPLQEATAGGHLDFVKLLLEFKADVNQKDDNGKTPLAFALQFKQPELAKLIREHGGVE